MVPQELCIFDEEMQMTHNNHSFIHVSQLFLIHLSKAVIRGWIYSEFYFILSEFWFIFLAKFINYETSNVYKRHKSFRLSYTCVRSYTIEKLEHRNSIVNFNMYEEYESKKVEVHFGF